METSNPVQTTHGRIEVIDFLRGVAIIEMIIVHYPRYYPLLLNKLISYTETAMPLFLLMSGFMVGYHYFPKFLGDGRRTARRLLVRALHILAIQYIIIATVNLPLYLISHGDIGDNEPLWQFLLKSAAFMNQIGIIHILPTFIPLFVVSPFILFLFKKRLDWVVILSSAALFTVGNFSPHLLDLGKPAIFPVIVVQIYFVAGCMWGKSVYRRGGIGLRRPTAWLAASCLALIGTMTLLHGKIFPGRLVSTHPLNVFGLIYQLPIIATIVLITIRFWKTIQNLELLNRWICLYGRHALLAFVIHLYWAKAMKVLNTAVALPAALNYLLILMNIGVGLLVLYRYEKHDRTQPALWVKAIDALFK